jgi:hypothetical protein
MIQVIYPVNYAVYFVICHCISIVSVKLKLEVSNIVTLHSTTLIEYN